jgi:carbon-monoxide dehydrogenase small subunit
VDGAEVMTIEGLMQTRDYQDIERGFERAKARPCRFCAAGKFLSVHALIENDIELNDETIRDALAGVWCRCTTHNRLVRGVQFAADYRARRRQRGS